MRHPSRLQISDLELIESGVEQELTSMEAKKIVGGIALLPPPVDLPPLVHRSWQFPPHRPKPLSPE